MNHAKLSIFSTAHEFVDFLQNSKPEICGDTDNMTVPESWNTLAARQECPHPLKGRVRSSSSPIAAFVVDEDEAMLSSQFFKCTDVENCQKSDAFGSRLLYEDSSARLLPSQILAMNLDMLDADDNETALNEFDFDFDEKCDFLLDDQSATENVIDFNTVPLELGVENVPDSSNAVDLAPVKDLAALLPDSTPKQPMSPSTESNNHSVHEFSSFTSAAGKNLPPPSENNLKRARILFDIDHEQPSSLEPFSGFKTGSGKKLVPPSEDAIKRAQIMFNEPTESNASNPKPNSGTAFSGFQTGRGNGIMSSAAALQKAKDLVCASLNEPFVGFQGGKERVPSSPSAAALTIPHASIGHEQAGATPRFLTGRGNPLDPPSAAALQRAKDLASFSSDEHFSGFQSGKGNALPPPSTAALKRAEALISNEPDVVTVGFQTGRGRTIDPPSEEALKKAKNTLIGVSGESFSGFQSGLGKTLPPPSAEALAKADRMLHKAPDVKASRPEVKRPMGNSSPSKLPKKLASFSMSDSWKRSRARPNNTSLRIANTVASSSPAPPVQKSLFDLQTVGKRYSLREFFKGAPVIRTWTIDDYLHLGVQEDILNITADTAANFKFTVNGSPWGADEAHDRLLSLGASPTCINNAWTSSHYRWIVWKFSSLIRSFPFDYGPENLSPEFILQQLLYRYEREVNNCQRSPLKRIIEQDDAANRYLVLMIASLREAEGLMELSDGWYSVWAHVDKPILDLIAAGKLYSGCKLEIFGAFLQAEEAIPALEASDAESSCKLRIHRNGMRRARWDAKLGLVRKRGFLRLLKNVYPNGGIVPAIRVVVIRRYPVCYVEEDLEKRRTIRQERDHYQYMESVVQSAGNCLPTEESDCANSSMLLEHRFSCFLKVRVLELASNVEAMLMFWHVDDHVLSLIKEGSDITLLSLRASGTKSFGGFNKQILSLSSTKGTRIFKHGDVKHSCSRQWVRLADLIHLDPGEDVDLKAVFLEHCVATGSGSSWTAWLGDDEGNLICVQGLVAKSSFPGGGTNQRGDLITVKDASLMVWDTRQSLAVLSVSEYTEIKRLTKSAALNERLWGCNYSQSLKRLQELRS